MKRLLMLPLIAATLAVAAPAIAGTTSTTDHVTETSTWDDVEFCDVLYDGTLVSNVVTHTTTSSDGREAVRATVTGWFTAEPSSGGGPIYTGHYTESFGYRLNAQNGSFTTTINFMADGSDGSRLRMVTLVHINQTASGEQVEFEQVKCR
jgi:hypothetical protein